ncbi:MAG: DUF4279 domain-containing protein [Lysobacterales bacterium]
MIKKSVVSYSVQLLIKHPELDPEEITNTIGMKPTKSWKRGDPVTTPTGLLVGGVHSDSSWSYSDSIHMEMEAGHFDTIEKLINQMYDKRAFFSKIKSSGSRLEFVLIFYDGEYISAEIAPEHLQKLCELGFSLGVLVTAN